MSDLGAQHVELGCLVKVNGEKWERKVLRFGNGSIEFLNGESFSLELIVMPDSCLSFTKISELVVVITACPKEDGTRKLTIFEVQFYRQDHLRKLLDFMVNENFAPIVRKKILVLINPASGKGKAPQIWKQIAEMTAGTGIDFEVLLTKRAGHAKEIVQNMDVEPYDGVVTVSGDGGLWEITNGLYARKDWPNVCTTLPVGIVPGGSGHAMHCSLLFHQKESFNQEYLVAALNIVRGKEMPYDYIECSTRTSTFLSLFGVAWGVIPEVDVGSEFMRFLGPSRGKILAIWRWFYPRIHCGTVHFQPFEDSNPSEMPDINCPVPSSWKTIEGPFLNVYACKQPWLDYEMFFCPDAKPDDGVLWLVIIMAAITRKDALYWMLNGATSGHLQSKNTMIFPIRAFRFVPSEPESAPMTVDAELLPGGLVQGAIKQNGVRIMVK